MNWSEDFATGADFNTTTLHRRFSPWVFKHSQRPPPALSLMQRCWCRSSLFRWWKRYNARKTVRACESGQLGQAKLKV